MLKIYKKNKKLFFLLVTIGLSFQIGDGNYKVYGEELENEFDNPVFNCNNIEKAVFPNTETSSKEDSASLTKIQKIEVVGSSVLPEDDIFQITSCFKGKEASIDNLLEIRTQITRLYVEKGYTTSAAFIPKGQDISQGRIKVQVVEGKIEEVVVKGLNRLNKSYVISRLPLDPPFNANDLDEAVKILQLDPLIQEIKADLATGTAPGLTVATIQVKEADSFILQLGTDNNRSPSVGSQRRGLILSENNLFGNGEQIEASYFNSEGSNSGYARLSIPITQSGTTIGIEAGITDNEIVESPFEILNLDTESRYYQVVTRHPVLKSLYDEVGLGVMFSRIENDTYLDGFRFPLSRGANERGETEISALRFFQDWIRRNNDQILFLRSQFSFGLNGKATIEPDSEFFSWNLQGQYLYQLAPDTVFVLRGELQQSDQPLLSDEQFRAGGGFSVRGYREDFLLSDNGFWALAEIQVPVLRISDWNAVVQLAPFVSHGVGWNNDRFPLDPSSITSVGLGLRWQQPWFGASLYWGIPLTDINSERRTLQENGIYFNLRLTP